MTQLQLRAATPADAVAILAIYSPLVEDTVISFEDEPPSLAEMTRRVTSVLTHYPWLVCEDEAGAFLGYAYASGHRVQKVPGWARLMAGGRLRKDQKRAAVSYAAGRVPQGMNAY